ncbi:hypothetical protein P4O66_009655 [Electrophorus voltai]|uniref:SRCR domain-containing protein n=1 Tax=Electrophorus voltai TaxID=2609070 RepID=A0AAD9DXL3_9TELE|nr:hypothetical protein P4O66_009655 [Electrophorus voltai]
MALHNRVGSLPVPTLAFLSSVNESDIKLFTMVNLSCTIPDEAPYPVTVFIYRGEAPSVTSESWIMFNNLRQADTIIFTLKVRPDREGPIVCWYKSSRTSQTSGFSNSVNLVISSLPSPIIAIYPPAVPVGGDYIAQCEIPREDFTNVTLSMFYRPLPIGPQKEAFKYIGSLALEQGNWACSVNNTDATTSTEFVCKMEVFINGRALHSTSSPVAAIPEELPARLYSSSRGTAACSGYLSVRVSDEWRPICFSTIDVSDKAVANVTCREVGCGHALLWERVSGVLPNAVGTPRCSGREQKLAHCHMDGSRLCTQHTLHVMCSGALPTPRLTVEGHVSVSSVYFGKEESVIFICSFNSSSLTYADRVYLTLNCEGKDMDTHYIPAGGSMRTELSKDKMKYGWCACYAHPNLIHPPRTENSNFIYIYDPPPAGPIVAAIITTVAGVAILMYVCVCRISQKHVQGAATQDLTVMQVGNNPIFAQGEPESTEQNLQQV